MIGKLRLLFWLGIVMLFLPFFGIPDTWKTALAILIGIGLVTIALLLRKSYRAQRIIIRNLEHTITQHTIHTPEPVHHPEEVSAELIHE
jgi:hypothetical protein